MTRLVLLASLTLLTWNTARMGGYKKPAENTVLQYLLQQEADIICLQEVDVYKNARFLTLSDVKQTLSTKYPYSYIDFSVYNSRHQYGTMIWSKYPLLHKQSIRYESRGNLSNRCDVVVGKDTIRLINNHLESYRFTAEDLSDWEQIESKWKRAVPLRNAQARAVRKEIEASPYPVVVAGDFNAPPFSYAYLYIARGLHDAWRETHPWTIGATCTKRGIGVRIDYLLSSPMLHPVSSSLAEGTKGSDHLPLTATFTW